MRHSNTISFDISVKFAVSIMSVLTLCFLLSGWFVISESKSSLHALLNSAKQVIDQQRKNDIQQRENVERKKAKQIGKLLSLFSPEALASFDMASLLSYSKTIVADPGFSKVEFLDAGGNVLTKTGKDIKNGNSISFPINAEDIQIGTLKLDYNLNELQQYMEEAEKQTSDQLNIITQSMASTHQQTAFRLGLIMIAIAVVIGVLAYVLFNNLVMKRLKDMEYRFQDIAEGEGDLRQRIKVSGYDAIDRLARNYNLFLEKLHHSMTKVSSAVGALSDSSKDLSAITNQTNEDLGEQNSEIEQVVSAMNEMSAVVDEVAHNASSASQQAQETDLIANKGKEVVQQSIDSIEVLANEVDQTNLVIQALQADSNEIGAILDVIRGIADQTNLLALNAAIEAARAGDHGRGFSVVADEVRTLASRTQQSTQEIQSMIEKLQNSSQKVVESMNTGSEKAKYSVEKSLNAGSSLDEITRSVAAITDMNAHIASAVEEQSATVNSINSNVNVISQISERTAANAQKTESASENLSNISSVLYEIVSKFKV